MNLLIKTLEMH